MVVLHYAEGKEGGSCAVRQNNGELGGKQGCGNNTFINRSGALIPRLLFLPYRHRAYESHIVFVFSGAPLSGYFDKLGCLHICCAGMCEGCWVD